MGEKRLFWQVFRTIVTVTTGALIVLSVFSAITFHVSYHRDTKSDLESRARLLEDRVCDYLIAGDYDSIDLLCKSVGNKSSTRITVILPDGKVVGESGRSVEGMDNHADREEIEAAYKGRPGVTTRYSDTTREKRMYVVVPLVAEGKVIGVLRTSVSLVMIEKAVYQIYMQIGVGLLVVTIIAGVGSWLVSRKLSRPLEEMGRAAREYASGNLESRVKFSGGESDEIVELGRSLDGMAKQLSARIRTIENQNNEREAILSSMTDWVIAVDFNHRIIDLNPAATEGLGVTKEWALGKTADEVIGDRRLQVFLMRALAAGEPVTVELSYPAESGIRFKASGAPLKDAAGIRIGSLAILHDISRLRRLESVRRDFVANVSHELRTPITAIQGYIETLLEGKAADAETVRSYLDIARVHTERLNTLIEDLLSLSRIEEEAQAGGVDFVEVHLRGAIDGAVQMCKPQADEKNIEISVDASDDCTVQGDFNSLVQALGNLVDNAVKYSDSGKRIAITCDSMDDEIVLAVRDEGCGIPAEHQPRIFERFYRADKARSRKLGGTGLGLSIVKHIVLAHKGRVEVKSETGAGSTFYVYLPSGAAVS